MANPAEKSSVGLLKVTFGKRTDGVWAITSLDSLELQPREPSEHGFYASADKIVTLSPSSFGPTTFHLAQSIVPIVAHVRGETILRCN